MIDPALQQHTVREYGTAWLDARIARKVAQADSERGWLENHIYPEIGNLPLGGVRPADIRRVVDTLVAKGLARGSIVHIRGTMHMIFDEAWRAEIIEQNPVARVKAPPLRAVKKQRVILSEEEALAFFACDEVDLEIRLMGLVARCEGGMRTRDVTAWDWQMIDRQFFASCIVPRTKTGEPQRLDIPDMLQAPLRSWWVNPGG